MKSTTSRKFLTACIVIMFINILLLAARLIASFVIFGFNGILFWPIPTIMVLLMPFLLFCFITGFIYCVKALSRKEFLPRSKVFLGFTLGFILLQFALSIGQIISWRHYRLRVDLDVLFGRSSVLDLVLYFVSGVVMVVDLAAVRRYEKAVGREGVGKC